MRGRADDAYVASLARAVAGRLGGKVGVAPRLFLKKLSEDYDPTDKGAALKLLRETAHRNEYATGVLYIEPAKYDFTTLLNLVDEPLATLPLERIRPGRDALDSIMESLR